jgi:uncharacterized membrane protein
MRCFSGVAGLFVALWMAGAPMALAAPDESVAAPSAKASLAHSGLKTATYEVANTIDNFFFLTAGAGDLWAGTLLTAFNTAQSFTVYTVNDYFWEKYNPRPVSQDGSFDAGQSAWRTTLKYMTGKPIVASIKIAALYAYTGSAATAFAFGGAATAGASVIFFVNNLAWDYYDSWAGGPAASPKDL